MKLFNFVCDKGLKDWVLVLKVFCQYCSLNLAFFGYNVIWIAKNRFHTSVW
jgi:hypothetical protein